MSIYYSKTLYHRQMNVEPKMSKEVNNDIGECDNCTNPDCKCPITSVRSEGMTELTKDDIDYPRDIFHALIAENSPYAFYIFQWVPYHIDAKRWRLKMLHDVKTFDGREAFGIWPNANSCGPFKDAEVEFIRISKQQYGEEWKDPRGVKE